MRLTALATSTSSLLSSMSPLRTDAEIVSPRPTIQYRTLKPVFHWGSVVQSTSTKSSSLICTFATPDSFSGSIQHSFRTQACSKKLPSPAFNCPTKAKMLSVLGFKSSFNLQRTRSWGLGWKVILLLELRGRSWIASKRSSLIPFYVSLQRVYTIQYLQFLVWTAPSSSLSRPYRAALKARPRIPSPHSFFALDKNRNIFS